ncbi:hypothetical protein KKHLCK_12745 [Candidatus Electrothrix laxa]
MKPKRIKIVRDNGMLLRKQENGKLSWEETYKAIPRSRKTGAILR